WRWVEINPERDWNAVNRCGRIQPRLIGAPAELLDLKTQLDAELEDVKQDILDTETDELLDRERALHVRLNDAEEKIAAYVGFDKAQQMLAGCYVSIGQDGTPFFDKGLVKPEHRKQLAKLLKTDDSGNMDDDGGDSAPPEPKNPMPESLRRDLADYRSQ